LTLTSDWILSPWGNLTPATKVPALMRFLYHLFHDNYHVGQIMQLRALQGLTPIE